jgi:hypothetical protein
VRIKFECGLDSRIYGMYILKLLLNIVTSRTEALVAIGNKYLHSCANGVYRLRAQSCFDTFHQLPIIVRIPTVSSVCKHLSLKCSSSGQVQTRAVREANYARRPQPMPLVLHGPIQSCRVLQ